MAKRGRHTHRKGPGGPSRPARPGRVTPPAPAPARGGVSFKGPSVESLVESLLLMVQDAAPPGAPGRPLGVELWADHMARILYDPDAMPQDFYRDLAEGLVASPHPDAPAVLAALAAALDHADAEPLRAAQAAAATARGDDDRSDLGIGRAVAVRAVVVDHVQGDGASIVVDFAQPGSDHSISAYVDHNLLGVAKDLSVGPPWDEQESRQEMLSIPDMAATGISLADARARIEDAMALTAHSPGAPVSDDYESVEPLVARRVASLPAGGTLPPRPVVDEDELDELVAAFVASPEASGLPDAAADEAAWVVELWIDHAVNETVGGPLRVSEVLVELFCTHGFALADPDPATVAAAPVVLEAWIRYATRTTGLRDMWRDEALDALVRFGPLLAEPAEDMTDERAHEAMADTSPHPPVELGAWEPLQPPAAGPLQWDDDLSGVRPDLLTRVKLLAPRAADLANQLLGPDFVEPAVDVVVAMGEVEPTALDEHGPIDHWAAAAVWLLAEDSGVFTAGRDPADLATALRSDIEPLAVAADQLRRQSGTTPGALDIPWGP